MYLGNVVVVGDKCNRKKELTAALLMWGEHGFLLTSQLNVKSALKQNTKK